MGIGLSSKLQQLGIHLKNDTDPNLVPLSGSDILEICEEFESIDQLITAIDADLHPNALRHEQFKSDIRKARAKDICLSLFLAGGVLSIPSVGIAYVLNDPSLREMWNTDPAFKTAAATLIVISAILAFLLPKALEHPTEYVAVTTLKDAFRKRVFQSKESRPEKSEQ